MIENNEDRSLLEVREWKEKCRVEDENLSPQEYLKKLNIAANKLKNRYNIHLQKISLISNTGVAHQ